MFMDTPQTLLYVACGAFVLGWLVAKISNFFGNRLTKAKQRDPRDDRIRSLEAELRIAASSAGKKDTQVEDLTQELAQAKQEIEAIERHLNKSEEVIQSLRQDLKDSVRKTRELRSELTERAAESVKSEVKLREVETELSVAQASTDLIATGVLDYSQEADSEADDDAKKPQVYQSGG